MPTQTLMERVIAHFQTVGPQVSNAVLIERVAELLRNEDIAVSLNHTITIKGSQRPGRIDMAIVDNGIKLGVEVDHRRPRRKSVLKLRSTETDFRLILLTHPKATAFPPQQEGGIDAIVALRHRDYQDSDPPASTETPAHRKKLDESAFDGRLLPCGDECITRRRQQKEQF